MTMAFLLVFLVALLPGCGIINGTPSPTQPTAPSVGRGPIEVEVSFPDGAPPLNCEARLICKVTALTFGAKNMSVNINLPESFELVSGNLSWVGDIAQGDEVEVEVITAVVRAVKVGNWTIETLVDYDPNSGFGPPEGGGHQRIYVAVSEDSAKWGITPPWYKEGHVEPGVEPVKAPSSPIKINLFTSEPPTLGKPVEVTATFNLEIDYQDAHNITVRIILPEGFEKVDGDLEWKGDIIRGNTYTLSARIKAIKTDNWKIEAQVSSGKSDGMGGYTALYVSVSDKTSTLPKNLLPPPWTSVNYYFDANKTIKVKIGEEFAIGFDTFERGGLIWEETHDEEMLATMDKELVMHEPVGLAGTGTTWFLFKALKAGETQITFKYYGPGGQLRDQKVFNIEIE